MLVIPRSVVLRRGISPSTLLSFRANARNLLVHFVVIPNDMREISSCTCCHSERMRGISCYRWRSLVAKSAPRDDSAKSAPRDDSGRSHHIHLLHMSNSRSSSLGDILCRVKINNHLFYNTQYDCVWSEFKYRITAI